MSTASTSSARAWTGPEVPHQRTQISNARPQPPHLGKPAQPFHPLLFLYSVLGPIILRVASFFPFHATYWLNGHSFIEQGLKRAHIGFRKNDNAFLAVDDVAALQAAADRLSPQIIRQRLDYWTFLLGPKFSKRERSQM